MKPNKSVAKESAMADNKPMANVKPVSPEKLVEFERRLRLMIQGHGYKKTLRTIEDSWDRGEMTWDAYQQPDQRSEQCQQPFGTITAL